MGANRGITTARTGAPVHPGGAAMPVFPATPLAAWSAWHDHLTLGRGHAPATLSAYRFVLLDFLAWLAPKRWDRATPHDLDRYLDRRTHNANGTRRVLSAATRRSYAKPVRLFYAWAHAARLTRTDRLAGYTLPAEPTPVGRGLDADELRRLFLVLSDDARVYAMAWLGFGQLLRAGEIARARVEDLDFAQGKLLVHGKGGRDEWMPLEGAVVPVLRGWLASGAPRRSGPLFESLTRPGAHLSPDRVYRLLGAAVKQVQEHASSHWLRHSGAQTLRRAGWDLDTITRVGRWANADTPRRYYLVGPEWDRARQALAGMGPPGGTSPPPGGTT
jgi:integrase/recombinase XerD